MRTLSIKSLALVLVFCSTVYAEVVYFVAYSSRNTPTIQTRTKNYGMKGKGFYSTQLIPCNTRYIYMSLVPSVSEYAALNALEAVGRGYFNLKLNWYGDALVPTYQRPLPIDIWKDWTVQEKSTPAVKP